jgi:hypothetical protein
MPTHQSYLLSSLPTIVHRETIFPAVEYGMKNLVCHNKGRTLTEVVWEINAKGNTSKAKHVTKRIEKIMSRGPSSCALIKPVYDLQLHM